MPQPIPEGMKRFLIALPLLAALSACEQLGIDDPVKVAAAKEAEGKAIGSACRHAMRAIEDCYVLNPRALKAAVYTGWREMDEYMRENKLEGITPVVPRPGARQAADEVEAKPAEKASEKTSDKASDKAGDKAKAHRLARPAATSRNQSQPAAASRIWRLPSRASSRRRQLRALHPARCGPSQPRWSPP